MFCMVFMKVLLPCPPITTKPLAGLTIGSIWRLDQERQPSRRRASRCGLLRPSGLASSTRPGYGRSGTATAVVRQGTQVSDTKERARRRPSQQACAAPQVRVGQGFVTLAMFAGALRVVLSLRIERTMNITHTAVSSSSFAPLDFRVARTRSVVAGWCLFLLWFTRRVADCCTTKSVICVYQVHANLVCLVVLVYRYPCSIRALVLPFALLVFCRVPHGAFAHRTSEFACAIIRTRVHGSKRFDTSTTAVDPSPSLPSLLSQSPSGGAVCTAYRTSTLICHIGWRKSSTIRVYNKHDYKTPTTKLLW